MQKLYDKLGRENKAMVFLFTDAHVADEGFLELINNMLTTGMVPALYDDGEKDACINSVRDEVAKAGLPETKDSCWAYFVNKCRDNLHVVLAMSPVGETLRQRCRSFPGMVNNTVIDWFDPWPEQALSAVATFFLKEEDLSEQQRSLIVAHMMMVHQSVRTFSARFLEELRRANYVTPKSYLDFISNYRTSLSSNRTKISDMAKRLDGGLQKLRQAAVEVEAMKQELSEAKVVVEAATKECNELIEVISKSKTEVEAKSKAASEKEEQLKIDSVNIAVEKEEAEAALAEAIPALEEAAAALSDLKKDDITEIRSFNNPNAYVKKVCECVINLKGLKDTSWPAAKAMMSDGGFLRSLVEFDKDALSDKQVLLQHFSIMLPSTLVSVLLHPVHMLPTSTVNTLSHVYGKDEIDGRCVRSHQCTVSVAGEQGQGLLQRQQIQLRVPTRNLQGRCRTLQMGECNGELSRRCKDS